MSIGSRLPRQPERIPFGCGGKSKDFVARARELERLPPRRVLAVEELTGIPRHVLRPDIYPPSKEQRGRR
jgi:hypothetical protein